MDPAGSGRTCTLNLETNLPTPRNATLSRCTLSLKFKGWTSTVEPQPESVYTHVGVQHLNFYVACWLVVQCRMPSVLELHTEMYVLTTPRCVYKNVPTALEQPKAGFGIGAHVLALHALSSSAQEGAF